jgi:uncharacterized protein (TIGR02996 family)
MASDATEKQFLAAIKADPYDQATRLMFSDWLQEQGRCEQADQQRLLAAGRTLEMYIYEDYDVADRVLSDTMPTWRGDGWACDKNNWTPFQDEIIELFGIKPPSSKEVIKICIVIESAERGAVETKVTFKPFEPMAPKKRGRK